MDDFDNRQARREVLKLLQLAEDANREGQYATMERLLEHAVSVTQRLNDLPLLVRVHHRFAYAQEMQGKCIQALATYSWLIGLATDPTSSQLLTDSNSLWYVTASFTRFVQCGRFMPEMPIEGLLRVVADGLDWLERAGQANRAASLRSEKGMLLQQQGYWEEARLEMETALALERRHPQNIYYPAVYQYRLADLLRKPPFKAYAESLALVEEILAVSTTNPHCRQRAYRTLAYTLLDMKKYEEALSAAQESLLLAQAMETPVSVTLAYELLVRIYRETGRMAQATQAVTLEWRWARHSDIADHRYNALTDCARVRNLQARVACGLPTKQAPFPEQIPAEAQILLALRRIQSARRFVQWATPLATQLDRQSGCLDQQEDLDKELQAASKLEAWLTQKGNR